MKRVGKGPEPDGLAHYRIANADGTWEQFRDASAAAYQSCRQQLILDQGDLCAYCEISIAANDPLKCRVEHFHPKAATLGAHNWALDWQNLLGVCSGGTFAFVGFPYAMEPLHENLSCDAHKDRMIQSGKLDQECGGWILNPLSIIATPSLFFLKKSNGTLEPDPAQCAAVGNSDGNRHPDLPSLVQNTIDMLNLNCDRLCEARKRVIWDIERNKKKERDAGHAPEAALAKMAERYLRRRWPEFFTTIRLALGPAAEAYLANIPFQG